MIGFLVVLVGTGILFFWVSRGPNGGKWAALVLAGFAGWMVLPSVFLQAHWGWYRESGSAMGEEFWHAFHNAEWHAEESAPYAAEVCPGVDVRDPSRHFAIMPEQEEVKHFFYYSKYSNIIRVGLGTKDRYCTARYFISERRKGGPLWIPRQLFPYPFFLWFSDAYTVERRFLDHLPPPPEVPDGIRALAPGQCAAGEVSKGEAHRFEVRVPDFGQTVRLYNDLYCAYGKDWSAIVEWTKDGRTIPRPRTGRFESEGGGLYRITVRAPASEEMAYSVGVLWGGGGCNPVKEASYDCVSMRDPDRPGGYIDVIRPKKQEGKD
jgi:hypothetical protein